MGLSIKWPILWNKYQFKKYVSICDIMGFFYTDKPRIGVKTLDGIAIGFVFCELNCPLSLLRNYVRQDVSMVSAEDKCMKLVSRVWSRRHDGHFFATILVLYLWIKSLQLIWRLGTRRFHLRVPNLQMSSRDLTTWQGTRIKYPAMAARQHALFMSTE